MDCFYDSDCQQSAQIYFVTYLRSAT